MRTALKRQVPIGDFLSGTGCQLLFCVSASNAERETTEAPGIERPTPFTLDMSRIIPSRLTDISGGMKEIEAELLTIYASSCQEALIELEKALKTRSIDNSVLHSHSLKSSSANLGAESVRIVSEHVETLAKQGRFEEAYAQLGHLNNELQATYLEYKTTFGL
ncbi:Hpt domain-containing protein [Planoprotostelium fungivorum]|uniref:Hpt domain-containing protein n=1 Tax=Planoprotostelium fungivorum TaxID=1890364 RepID=A0A2P6NCD6_9EUKA|nr:Hpt domain-containing protein [Planoprotostelium fungivorum]